jgi:hypothetical protein
MYPLTTLFKHKDMNIVSVNGPAILIAVSVAEHQF